MPQLARKAGGPAEISDRPDRLEKALGLIADAELALRSSRPAPAAALVERLLVRLAMLGRGRE